MLLCILLIGGCGTDSGNNIVGSPVDQNDSSKVDTGGSNVSAASAAAIDRAGAQCNPGEGQKGFKFRAKSSWSTDESRGFNVGETTAILRYRAVAY